MVGRSPDLTGARERRFIVPRSRRRGRTQRASFLPLASTPTRTHTFAEEHRRRPDRAREGTHVGETGNAAAAQYRAPLKIGLERSRSTARIASETRAHKARSGRACDAAHIGQPSPGSEGGGPHGPHTVGGAKRARGGQTPEPLTRLTGAPTNHSGECGGAFTGLVPERPHPCLPHTTSQRWGGQTRGPLAEREERPPFAMNVRPSPGAA